MIIRNPRPGDLSGWQVLWQGYLDFYQATVPVATTQATWARLLDPAAPVKMRLAEDAGQILGFAIHVHHPSTWGVTDDCYLEDLFVGPAARGHGAGRALVDDLLALARAKGWNRVYWHTDRGNARARALYDSYGLADDMVRYRIAL